jgi:hypothetical protein
MSRKYISIGVGMLALISFIGPFLLGLPPHIAGSLSISMTIAVLYTSAAVIYLLSLKNFTRSLKVAYIVLCIGALFLAAGMIQLAVIGAFNLWATPWVTVFHGIDIPFILSTSTWYIGMAIFGKTVGVKRVGLSIIGVVVIAIIGAALTVALPHIPDPFLPEIALKSVTALAMFQTIILVGVCILALIIKKRAGALYAPALTWVFLACAFSAIATLQQSLLQVFLPADNWYVQMRLHMLFNIISGALSVKTALAFNAISSLSTLPTESGTFSFFGKSKETAKSSPVAIDVIVFTAELVSALREVNPILDKMRVITASKGQNPTLTAEEEETLAGVYLKLEQYLTQRDPVRRYTTEELRVAVQRRFKDRVKQTPFWALITGATPGVVHG